jgi:NAD(P)H-hydrate epimerase
LKGLSGELVQHINQSSSKIIAIDVPSGMFIDKSSTNNILIKAAHTLSFQTLKLCFLMPENAAYFGCVQVLDIQLHPKFLPTVSSVFETTELSNIKEIFRPRKLFAHKGNFGHALVIAGNSGSAGAAIMAVGAALRTGVGLLTANIPDENFNALLATYPEAMLMSRKKELTKLDKFNALAIGCGLGTNDDAKNILQETFNNFSKPIVVDADALNIISFNTTLLRQIPANSILTPHPKEFDRLFGICENDFERANKAIELSVQHNFIIILKGHYTLIAHNGKGYFNTTGNAGLAKGGSGDTLTGMLVALLAQGYNPLQTSILGVYLHGLAADLSLKNQSPESLLATDVIKNIGNAFNFLHCCND